MYIFVVLSERLLNRTAAQPQILCTALLMMGQASSECNNEFYTLMGLYLLACGTPRRQFDVLAHAGLTVSYSTALTHLKQLSEEGIKQAVSIMHTKACAIVWDNLNIAFRVGQQRLNSRDSFENGTTATLIPLYGVAQGDLPLSLLPSRQNRRFVLDIKPHLTLPTPIEITQLCQNLLWYIRNTLLEHSPALKARFSTSLGLPPAVHKIPLHTTHQYPLKAMHIDKSSLDGTLGVIDNIIRVQLQMTSEDLECHGVVFAHGNNLTIALIDMAQSARRGDMDISESLKWAVGQLGLFHVKMAGCWMTLNQHWGSPNSKHGGTLWKENSLLGRKAISAGWKAKKLPPFPQSHELIHLSCKARILDGVRVLAGADSLEQWIENKPTWSTIEEVTERVLDELCSGQPVEKMRRRNDTKERDITFENIILANRDMLLYIELVASIKCGDVRHVLNVLSHWMVMMRGTGSMPKYADALLQVWLMLDSWPKELQTAFLNNWLLNLSGTDNGWKEVDLNQEHQNFWAKVRPLSILWLE